MIETRGHGVYQVGQISKAYVPRSEPLKPSCQNLDSQLDLPGDTRRVHKARFQRCDTRKSNQ